MKVAILSMQEVKNYGSFLQAWSLKHTIESLGHTCDFINIVPGEQIGDYKQERFASIRKIADRLIGKGNPIKRIRENLTFQKGFDNIYFPMLGVKPGYVNQEHYDVVVIGSDEVFNCAQRTWFGFSRQLFGDSLNADKVITYAACFGATDVKVLTKLGIKDEVASLLKKMAKISVRDINSFDTTKELTGAAPEMNVDPVLIYDYTELMPKSVPMNEDYMVVYTYYNRIKDPATIKAICDYAKSHHLKIVTQNYYSWSDKVVTVSPFELLAYVRDAKCVVTDTFHGSVFSIKFNRPFCTIVLAMNNNKLTHLLTHFGLSKRKVTDPADLAKILDTPIDYAPVNEKIAEEKNRSLNYLRTNIL